MNDDVLLQHLGLRRLGALRVSSAEGAYFRPATDVYETDDAVVVTIEVAGLQEDAFEVTLSSADRILTVTGRRFLPVSGGRFTYHQLEIQQGRFMSQVYLPWPLADAQAAEATYGDGFLVVTLPKPKPRQVPIRTLDIAGA